MYFTNIGCTNLNKLLGIYNNLCLIKDINLD
jgi:hypothetical protein